MRFLVRAVLFAEQDQTADSRTDHTGTFQWHGPIGAVIDDFTGPFDIGRFGQMSAAFPDDPRKMQCGYDEGLLSADGETFRPQSYTMGAINVQSSGEVQRCHQ